MTDGGFLLDLNVLMALTDEHHLQHLLVMKWFDQHCGENWATCAFTQAGLIRLKTSPRTGGNSIADATEILRRLEKQPGHHFWPVTKGWLSLTEPFADRVYGHQQVTDAYLLGLAVEKNGVLATMDKGIRYLAGDVCRKHIVVIE